MSQATRCVKTRVLPLPAPASTKACPSGPVTASRCALFRGSMRSETSIAAQFNKPQSPNGCPDHVLGFGKQIRICWLRLAMAALRFTDHAGLLGWRTYRLLLKLLNDVQPLDQSANRFNCRQPRRAFAPVQGHLSGRLRFYERP